MAVTVKRFSADVVVAGGGVAGAAAAIAAGRAGKRVFLLEYRESLGGLVTNGYITGIAGCVDGLCKEWLDRLNAEGHATMRPHLPVIEPEYGRVMLEQMVLQSGARILYGTHVVDVVKEDNRIKSVVAYCKNGRIELDADVFVDATGDADLAMAAGCPSEPVRDHGLQALLREYQPLPGGGGRLLPERRVRSRIPQAQHLHRASGAQGH